MTLSTLIPRIEQAGVDEQRELLERFMTKVVLDGECWRWTGQLRGSDPKQARGQFYVNRRYVSSARWIYQYVNPDDDMTGKFVLHSCDNAKCVNPSHLSLGTQAENVADMWKRGRAHQQVRPGICKNNMARLQKLLADNPSLRGHGERNRHARLTTDQVLVILSSKEPTRILAARYGVNRSTIQRIRGGTSWKLAIQQSEPPYSQPSAAQP